MSQRAFDRRIARLAAANLGVFSRAMAVRLGASEGAIQRRVGSGRWISLYRGVYVLAGTPPSWQRSVLAACLACGRSATASHVSAGALWPMPGVEPGAIEISVPRGRHPRHEGIVIHTTRLTRADVAKLGPIPVTTPARTLIDLAARLPRDGLEEALDDALRRELVTVATMQRRIAAAGGRRGIDVLRALVAARDPDAAPPQSPLETRVLRLIRRSGLPEPIRQYEVTDGRRRAVVDFAWPDQRVAVEVDGYRYHSGRRRWENDRARQNMLTLLGWRVIHVTARDLKRPDEVATRIAAALALAGR